MIFDQIMQDFSKEVVILEENGFGKASFATPHIRVSRFGVMLRTIFWIVLIRVDF